MKFPRRNFLRLAAGAVALPAVSRIARAQTYPTRPVRIVVGFAAGGGSDIIARIMGQWLSERTGQPFVIENSTGGGHQHRHRSGGTGTCGWIHAPTRQFVKHGQCGVFRTTQFQFRPRHRAGREHQPRSQCHGDQPISTEQDGSGFYRVCQGQPGQDQYGLLRQRDVGPRGWGAIQDDDGHQPRARALSRRCTCAH